ncbi:hypothetical protein [Alicyclobacillus ferrooxydans]|uniref:hypothetical protein n=1 Tax=Alicyclobacillus ferrooxydans TaxID=471514 RepID=UPI0012EE0589|nr:hypothetical protein [Alicyclobacillus ferrooxydans]
MSNDAQSSGNMTGHGGGAIVAPNHVHIGSLVVLSALILIVVVALALNMRKKR